MSKEEEVRGYLAMDIADLEAQLDEHYTPDEFAKYTGDTGKPPKSGEALQRTIGAIQNSLSATPVKFRKVICEDLRYCERRKNDIVNLVISVGDCILMAKLVLIFPPLILATYLVRKGILDKFCRCDVKP